MNMIFRMFYVIIRSLFCERLMAEGTSKGCVYARGVGVVKPADAFAAVEQDKLK